MPEWGRLQIMAAEQQPSLVLHYSKYASCIGSVQHLLLPAPFNYCTLQIKQLHEIDLGQLSFVGEALTALRKEVRRQVS